MNRISVMHHGEYNGMWFDADKAEEFQEETYWNGNNYISKATGSQREHEKLYFTKSGKWILHSWSDWQGRRASTELISLEEAVRWFARNEYKDEDIPKFILKELENYEL